MRKMVAILSTKHLRQNWGFMAVGRAEEWIPGKQPPMVREVHSEVSA